MLNGDKLLPVVWWLKKGLYIQFTDLFFLDHIMVEEHVGHYAGFLEEQLVALWLFVIVTYWNKLT